MMPHEHGECFGGDVSMGIDEDPCLACAWYRIRKAGHNELVMALSDDYQRNLRLIKIWLARVPNRGEISLRRLYDMLRGLRFQHIKVRLKGQQYHTRLTHESGMLYDGCAGNASDSIGAAVASYIAALIQPERARA